MILDVLVVMLGSALGGGARYGAEVAWPYGPPDAGLPMATLAVNIAGSLIAGAVLGLTLPGGPLPVGRTALFLVTGFCGGFTTFSAFSLHTVAMLQEGEPWLAFVYVLLSVVLSVVAAGLGYVVGSQL